jgi:hypothetical protein
LEAAASEHEQLGRNAVAIASVAAEVPTASAIAVVASTGTVPHYEKVSTSSSSDEEEEEKEEETEEEEEEERAIYAEGENVEVRCDGDWYPGVVQKVRWVNGNEVVDCYHGEDNTRTHPMANGGDIRHQRGSASSDTDDDVPLARKRVRTPSNSSAAPLDSDDDEALSKRRRP